ncbi:zinc finger domain-containing protein [Sphaerisporangium rhizosphaerae]|uniref:Recombinase family protein n=1 Tax=Sphaerisporangium rhizosphaerae TaxID=2269375 RepID=A0ABW2P8G2_9ACTN
MATSPKVAPCDHCDAPAGAPCRTGRGKVAVQYHTARFRLVPALAKALNVPSPAIRKPGTAWIEPPRPAAADVEPAGHVRIGYARASTGRQSLDAQLDVLKAAGVTRVFAEKISTRATTRPELDKAVTPRPRPSCACCATTTNRPRSDPVGPVKTRGAAERGSHHRRIASAARRQTRYSGFPPTSSPPPTVRWNGIRRTTS